MSFADGSQVQLADVSEATIGTTPATPTFQKMRYRTASVRLNKQVDVSDEVRADRNVPGIIANINERFSRAGINIAAQYLQTTALVGYVVIDIDASASQVALDELCGIDGTIRCRILY